MHIADAILHANSASVVLFLLTSYIEAVRYDRLAQTLPTSCMDGEYRSADDVARCLDAMSTRAESRAQSGSESVGAEMRRVFSAALSRLRQLEQSPA